MKQIYMRCAYESNMRTYRTHWALSKYELFPTKNNTNLVLPMAMSHKSKNVTNSENKLLTLKRYKPLQPAERLLQKRSY